MPQFFIFRSPIKMMHLVIALSVWVYVVSTNSVDRFTNNKDLQFGFGSNCYLYWRGDSGNTKNAEFRCKKASGDHFGLRNDQVCMQLAHMLEVYAVLYIGEVIRGTSKMQSSDVANRFLICFGYAPRQMDFLLLVFLTVLYIGEVMKGIQRIANLDVANPYLTCSGLKEMVVKYQK